MNRSQLSERLGIQYFQAVVAILLLFSLIVGIFLLYWRNKPESRSEEHIRKWKQDVAVLRQKIREIERQHRSQGGRIEKVNVNRASASELEKLPGIGPKLAARVVEYRKKYGPFRNIQDLVRVKGIGPKLAKRLRPYLRFEE
jgi:competence protein ComEA